MVLSRGLQKFSEGFKDIIGTERTCVPNDQRGNLTKPPACQVVGSIIEKSKGTEAGLHGLDPTAGAESLSDSMESVTRRKHVAFSSPLVSWISGASAWVLWTTQELSSSVGAPCPAVFPVVAVDWNS